MTSRRYLGSWVLPSGNSCFAYWTDAGLACLWDEPPSAAWPAEDVEHWRTTTFPAVLEAVARVTKAPIVGVSA